MHHRLVLAFAALLLGALAVRADIATGPWGQPTPRPWGQGAPPPGWHPPEPVHVEAPLVVEPAAGEDQQTRLRLPGSLLKQLQVAPIEEAPRGWAPTPTGTVVAGLALSVALALGGLWIIRRPQRRWISGAVAATVVVVVGVSGCPPLLPYRTIHLDERLYELQVQPGNVLAGKALLEVSDKDDSIQLTVGQKDLAEWADKATVKTADEAAEAGAATK